MRLLPDENKNKREMIVENGASGREPRMRRKRDERKSSHILGVKQILLRELIYFKIYEFDFTQSLLFIYLFFIFNKIR